MASKTAVAVDPFAAMFESAEIAETAVRAAVEAPPSVIAFLTRLREPGPTGGKQRARLPLNGKSYSETVAVLRAGAKLVEPASSVTVKPVYADGDEYTEEVDGKTVLKVREGAEPVAVSLSVGDRRGAKDKTDVQIGGEA